MAYRVSALQLNQHALREILRVSNEKFLHLWSNEDETESLKDHLLLL